MVIDVAKGVEEQTEKLFEVCKMRNIPIITFVNKCDRAGLEPLEILSNIENQLGIKAVPATWPLGYGRDFKGIYDIQADEVTLYSKSEHGTQKAKTDLTSIEEGLEAVTISEFDEERFREEALLVQDEIDMMAIDSFLNGEVTPVFFGSALNNFGVDKFLEYFPDLAPPPNTYKNKMRKNECWRIPFPVLFLKCRLI